MAIFELSGSSNRKTREISGPLLITTPEHLIESPKAAALLIAANTKSNQDLQIWARDLYMAVFDQKQDDQLTLGPICELSPSEGAGVVTEFIARTMDYGIDEQLPELYERFRIQFQAMGRAAESKEFFISIGRTIESLSETRNLDPDIAAGMISQLQPFMDIRIGDLQYGQVFNMPRVTAPLPASD